MTVWGSSLQIGCRLILLISEHPIQQGIRKECWHRIPGNGTEFLEIWPPPKKTAFSGGKTKKKLPKFFFWLRDTYKKYILQKNWVKTAIPALSSGQNNLQTPIWGCHRQLDDQHRNPNMNNKDHIVGQLTTMRPTLWQERKMRRRRRQDISLISTCNWCWSLDLNQTKKSL